MRLNVEINAKAGNWDDDKLRRKVKSAIIMAVGEQIDETPYAELNSLRLYVPKPKRRVTRKKVEA
jgi:hypothetical protein